MPQMQVDNLQKFLSWVKSSPCQFTVSSMSGGYVHVKFLVPCDKEIARTRCYNTLEPTPRDQWDREVKEAEAIEDAIEDRDKEIARTHWYDTIDVDLKQIGRDALIIKCYDDGFRDGRHIAEEDSDADNS